MPTLSVAHLVRRQNGIAPFRDFIASYRAHPAGVPHELVILYKGFPGGSGTEAYEELLAGLPHTSLHFADFGFDLRPYFLCAERSASDYLCFLNSFSVLQSPDWLLKLFTHATAPGVGMAGATGSWGSVRPGKRTVKHNLPLWKWLLRPLAWKLFRFYFGLYFPAFPNYHLRTNAFVVARLTMGRIRRGPLLTKMQAYRLESGKNSVTRQVEQMGLRAVVVGRDGLAYEREQWRASNTFWCAGQHNLLVADNQTRKYDTATPQWRAFWSRFAWGEAADLDEPAGPP